MVHNRLPVVKWASWKEVAEDGRRRRLPRSSGDTTDDWFDIVPLSTIIATARILPDPRPGAEEAKTHLVSPYHPISSLKGRVELPAAEVEKGRGGRGGARGVDKVSIPDTAEAVVLAKWLARQP